MLAISDPVVLNRPLVGDNLRARRNEEFSAGTKGLIAVIAHNVVPTLYVVELFRDGDTVGLVDAPEDALTLMGQPRV